MGLCRALAGQVSRSNRASGIPGEVYQVFKLLKRLVSGEEGQGLVEYALIIALIAVILIASLQGVRTAIVNVFTSIVAGLGGGAP
jgi:pilus assembly protein Flp/PilA